MTSMMSVLDHTGDTRHEWDPSNEDEVAIARTAFDVAKGRGMLAYQVKDGENVQLHEFDPEARQIVLSPAPVGG